MKDSLLGQFLVVQKSSQTCLASFIGPEKNQKRWKILTWLPHPSLSWVFHGRRSVLKSCLLRRGRVWRPGQETLAQVFSFCWNPCRVDGSGMCGFSLPARDLRILTKNKPSSIRKKHFLVRRPLVSKHVKRKSLFLLKVTTYHVFARSHVFATHQAWSPQLM